VSLPLDVSDMVIPLGLLGNPGQNTSVMHLAGNSYGKFTENLPFSYDYTL
jgi:hypothetical protein